MVKKTKTRFVVAVTVDKLMNVPYVQGYFFSKVKLLNGNVTMLKTKRRQVESNTVLWDESADFEVKICTDATGVLVPCFVKVSVRRERKGGISIEKLGAVTIDLTAFAGAGRPVEKRYLLQAGSKNTDKKQGKDNSMLQVTVKVSQMEGAPIFRAHSQDTPTMQSSRTSSDEIDAGGAEASADDPVEGDDVDLDDLEASVLRLHEASTTNNVGTTALPAVDPAIWMGTRENPVDVVDKVLNDLGPPVFLDDGLDPTRWGSISGEKSTTLEDAFLLTPPKK